MLLLESLMLERRSCNFKQLDESSGEEWKPAMPRKHIPHSIGIKRKARRFASRQLWQGLLDVVRLFCWHQCLPHCWVSRLPLSTIVYFVQFQRLEPTIHITAERHDRLINQTNRNFGTTSGPETFTLPWFLTSIGIRCNIIYILGLSKNYLKIL